MKKLFLTLLVASCLTISESYSKDRFYIGGDIIQNRIISKYEDRGYYQNTIPLPENSTISSQNRMLSYGVSSGYTKDICNKIFIAPEIFYDQLNNFTKDYFYNDPYNKSAKDGIAFNSRYGFKMNLGYNINDKLSSYINVGVSKVNYKFKYESIEFTQEKFKTSPIFGIGASFKLNKNIALRGEYNHQHFNMRYGVYPSDNGSVARSKVRIDAIKIGILYSF